jgi:hypothetical protein
MPAVVVCIVGDEALAQNLSELIKLALVDYAVRNLGKTTFSVSYLVDDQPTLNLETSNEST